MGMVLCVWGKEAAAQMPVWVEALGFPSDQVWRIQVWEHGETARIAHERGFAKTWFANCQAMQAGSYFRADARAGPVFPLSPRLDVAAQAGFQTHRWKINGAINRRLRPHFTAMMQADLSEEHRLEVGFLAATIGKLPPMQARTPVGIHGRWKVVRPIFRSEASVLWTAEGSAVQWEGWLPLNSGFTLGMQWRILAGFIGLQVRGESHRGRWTVGMLHSMQWSGMVWCLDWRPTFK